MSRRRIVAVLLLLCSLAVADTTNDTTITDDTQLSYAPAIHKKWLIRFDLPSINGTVTAAVLHCNALGSSVGNDTIAAYTSTASFSSGNSAATNDAIALGTQLDSKSLTGVAGDQTWTITGDGTKGIVQAYNASATAITVILYATSYTTAAASESSPNQSFNTLGDPAGFNAQIFDGHAGTTPPYIAITYTPNASTAKPGSGSAGVLVF